MGMLMHHTWLAQQKKTEAKPVEQKAKVAEEPKPEEPVKKTVNRRKGTSK